MSVPNLKGMTRMPTFDTKIAYAEQVQGAAATTGAASLSWMAHSTLGYGKVPRTPHRPIDGRGPHDARRV